MMKKITNKKGLTIVELIVSLAIVIIFFISLTQLLAVGSKMYLHEVQAGNSEVMLETIVDDIKGYVRYGTDIRVMYVMKDGSEIVPGMASPIAQAEEGSEIYLNEKGEWIHRKPNGVVAEIIMYNAGDFYGNGIDLGFKKIYLKDNGDYTVIQGLAYSPLYYRSLNIEMQIRDLGPVNEGTYEIDVTGNAVTRGRVNVKSNVAVTALNR